MAGHSARETVTERNKIMGEMNNARFKFRVYVFGRKKTYDVIRWFNFYENEVKEIKNGH